MEILLPTNPAKGAFGNKFKSLLTSIRSRLPYRVNELEGFSDLLEPSTYDLSGVVKGHRLGCWRLALTPEESLITYSRDKYPEYFDCDWHLFNLKFARLRTIDGCYHKTPSQVAMNIVLASCQIPWNSTVKHIFETIINHVGTKKLLGVSVRSWKNPYELQDPLAQHRAKSFSLEKYKKKVEQLARHVDGVYISVDSPELEDAFDIPNRVYLPSLENLTPTQRMLAKCYMLSKCDFLIGDTRSTFLESAWILGRCSSMVFDALDNSTWEKENMNWCV
jgi:hypothetical protein